MLFLSSRVLHFPASAPGSEQKKGFSQSGTGALCKLVVVKVSI